jgi:hypothetical protein
MATKKKAVGRKFFLFSVLVCFFIGLCFSYFKKKEPPVEIDRVGLSEAFIKEHQKKDGFFEYEFDFVSGELTPWDNLIHQAQTAYVLSLISPSSSEVFKALKAFENSSLETNYGGRFLSFYAMRPELVRPAYSSLEKRGAEAVATGFALLTLQNYEQASADENTFATVKKDWLDGVTGFTDDPVSSVPSMLWYVMAELKQTRKNSAYSSLSILDRSFLNSAVQKEGLLSEEDYAFKVLAALKRYEQTKKETFLRYISFVTDSFLKKNAFGQDGMKNRCLLSMALRFSAKEEALSRAQIEEELSSSFFILPDQKWISLGGGRALYSPVIKDYAGSFIEGRSLPKIRIDQTAKCLWMMLSEKTGTFDVVFQQKETKNKAELSAGEEK